jgi:chromate transport protein ChrA
MLVQIAIANVLTFGNGTVMAAVLQNSFVQQKHVLTNDQLLFAFAIARVTPGQANLYVASIAYDVRSARRDIEYAGHCRAKLPDDSAVARV